ncbi:MAG: type II secretion system F family protein [Lachnospiraceae bacterium]|nr:type II secretion system F family protein [Lachnospiraceae bacterium]
MKDALEQLYPLKNQEVMYEEHQVKKLCTVCGIVFIGIVSVVCLRLSSQTKDRLTEGAQLIRNEWGAGDYSVTLQAENADREWQKEFSIQIGERQFTEEERILILDETERMLPELIKGKNTDLQHVENNLLLPSSLEDYPVNISWRSSSVRIQNSGEIDRIGLSGEGERAELTAELSCGQEKRVVVYEVCLLPEQISDEEAFFRALEETVLEAEDAGNVEKELQLPLEINGQRISWRERKEDISIPILLIVLMGALAVAGGMDKDLENCCKDRRKQLLTAYPDFLSKLRLYLSAGMTIKVAFYKLAEDYGRESVKRNYLSEELQLACNRFRNGVSEEKVYQEWGKRCVEIRYRRLSLLLCSHLRMGSGQLLRELEAEEESAREERKHHARKLGEEAGVKLLFPMLLQLLVVLFLILIPAYLDFGAV